MPIHLVRVGIVNEDLCSSPAVAVRPLGGKMGPLLPHVAVRPLVGVGQNSLPLLLGKSLFSGPSSASSSSSTKTNLVDLKVFAPRTGFFPVFLVVPPNRLILNVVDPFLRSPTRRRIVDIIIPLC